jgi:hypothetical protein
MSNIAHALQRIRTAPRSGRRSIQWGVPLVQSFRETRTKAAKTLSSPAFCLSRWLHADKPITSPITPSTLRGASLRAHTFRLAARDPDVRRQKSSRTGAS